MAMLLGCWVVGWGVAGCVVGMLLECCLLVVGVQLECSGGCFAGCSCCCCCVGVVGVLWAFDEVCWGVVVDVLLRV